MSSWQHTAVHRDLSSSVQEGFNINEWGCSAFATWSSLPCMSDCKLYCERAGNARLKGFVCLQQSRAGNGQDLIYLVLGIICWCCSKTIILLKWSRNHLLRAGLVFSLWKGAMPAHLVATGSVTTCTGRTDPKWGDVWLSPGPSLWLFWMTAYFFQFVSFSSLVFAGFTFI